MRAAGLLLALVLAWPSAGWGSPPDAPELTPAEEKTLAARGVVVRQETTETGAVTVAVVSVRATPAATLDAVLDLEPRKDEVSNITEVTTYLHEPERRGVTFDLSVMGVAVRFHTIYEIFRDTHFTRYALDPAREHDVVKAEGYYRCFADGSATRLVYAGSSDSGRRVPAWLKRWMANNALEDQLRGIRDRAEAGS
jgi:hypothetical protein